MIRRLFILAVVMTLLGGCHSLSFGTADKVASLRRRLNTEEGADVSSSSSLKVTLTSKDQVDPYYGFGNVANNTNSSNDIEVLVSFHTSKSSNQTPPASQFCLNNNMKFEGITPVFGYIYEGTNGTNGDLRIDISNMLDINNDVSTNNRFVTVEKINERWFFVDGNGKPFIQKGVVHTRVALEEKGKQFGEIRMDINRHNLNADLVRMGFNSYGYDYGTQDIPHGMMYVNGPNIVTDFSIYKSKEPFDIFDQREKEKMATMIKMITNVHRNSTELIGYMFTDIPNYRSNDNGWVKYVIGLNETSPGKQVYMNWKEAKNNKEDNASNDPDDDDFLFVIMEELYRTISEIFRMEDPNHLLIGDNYGEWLQNNQDQLSIMTIAAKYVDVLSVQPNWTPNMELQQFWDPIYAAVNKPIMISDMKIPFNVPGKDYDSYGPYNRSQDEAGKELEKFFDQFLSTEYMIGWSHCEYVTEKVNNKSEFGTKLGLYDDIQSNFTPYETYQKYVITMHSKMDTFVAATTNIDPENQTSAVATPMKQLLLYGDTADRCVDIDESLASDIINNPSHYYMQVHFGTPGSKDFFKGLRGDFSMYQSTTCVDCTDKPTPWMTNNGWNCSYWFSVMNSTERQYYCNDNYWRNDDNNFCQKSCYLDGYDDLGFTCCGNDNITSLPSISSRPTPSPPSTANPTMAIPCRECTDNPTPWMIDAGWNCSEWMIEMQNLTSERQDYCQGDYWRNNNFCRKSCYVAGYDIGLACCNSDDDSSFTTQPRHPTAHPSLELSAPTSQPTSPSMSGPLPTPIPKPSSIDTTSSPTMTKSDVGTNATAGNDKNTQQTMVTSGCSKWNKVKTAGLLTLAAVVGTASLI